MTTTTLSSARRPWWRGWADFWFRPSDPTTLAFIRICTGLLVFYIHLAYCFDLQAFFGENGWYALRFVDKERHELPSFSSSFTDWEEPYQFVQLSYFPHRREAFMQFLRQTYLPDPKQPDQNHDPSTALAYLFRVNEMRNPTDASAALVYVKEMTHPEKRDRLLDVLAGKKVEEPAIGPKSAKTDTSASYQPPHVFVVMTDEEKARVISEIRALLNAFDRVVWRDAVSGRSYVFAHLLEIPPEARKSLIGFMNSLTKLDLAERRKLLDYFDYWNNDPRTAYRIGFSTFSIWFHVTDPTAMAILHTGILILIFMFTIGLFSRVTSVLVWVAVIGYIHRTQQVLFGMDTMMNILLFYLMIGNCGAALSVDRLIARYRAARASIARCGRFDATTRAFLACPPPSVSAGFAQRLIQVHFCFIYMAAGLSKLKGVMWWDGRAFWEVLVNPEFTLIHYAWYEATVRWIAEVKPLYYTTIAISVWFTLFIEIGLPFLVWTRMRWLIIFLAVAMHSIIAVLMGLNLFELLMIVMLLAYLPDRVIRDRFRGGPNLAKYHYAINPASLTQAKAASLAIALDVDNQIALTPDEHAGEPSVSGKGLPAATRQEGARALFRGLRLFNAMWVLLLIPGLKGLLTRRLFPTAADRTPSRTVKPSTPAAR